MNIVLHESPFIDSIFYVPVNMYEIEHDFCFRGSPSVHEHIILNENCAVITFFLNNQVLTFDSNVVCGKFTHPPKIKIFFKNSDKKLAVIRLNSYGMFKLSDMPISAMVDRILPGSTISIDLSENMKMDHSLQWIESMMAKEIDSKSYAITLDIIRYIDENFAHLPSNVGKVVAEEFALSESTVLRYFKKYIGVNLSTYLVTLKRKKMIQAMCSEKYDLQSVRENGYYDQSHFLNDFRRLYRISMKQYFKELKMMKHKAPDLVNFMYNCNYRSAV